MSISVEELDKTVQAFYEGRGEVVSYYRFSSASVTSGYDD